MTVINKFIWKQRIDKVCTSYSAKIKVLKKSSLLTPKPLEEIYWKTMIPSLPVVQQYGRTAQPLFLTALKTTHKSSKE